jgi:hypothetical protein
MPSARDNRAGGCKCRPAPTITASGETMQSRNSLKTFEVLITNDVPGVAQVFNSIQLR